MSVPTHMQSRVRITIVSRSKHTHTATCSFAPCNQTCHQREKAGGHYAAGLLLQLPAPRMSGSAAVTCLKFDHRAVNEFLTSRA